MEGARLKGSPPPVRLAGSGEECHSAGHRIPVCCGVPFIIVFTGVYYII